VAPPSDPLAVFKMPTSKGKAGEDGGKGRRKGKGGQRRGQASPKYFGLEPLLAVISHSTKPNTHYFARVREVRSIAIGVRMFVFLIAYFKNHIIKLYSNVRCKLPMAVTWSYSDNNTTSYVTSDFADGVTFSHKATQCQTVIARETICRHTHTLV